MESQRSCARVRSSSNLIAPPSWPPGGSVLNVPGTHLEKTRSYPCSPSISSTQQRQLSSMSYPVFPVYAQSSSGGKPPFREAVLHTKNPLAVGHRGPAPSSSRPKMHLYAADKKPSQSAPKDEEFPDVPVEWLMNSLDSSESSSQTPSDGSSVSLSGFHSGEASEDESDSCLKSPTERNSSPPLVILEHRESACQFLSVGLKALLKVQA